MTTNTTYPGDRDPQSDPADEWDREVSPAQTLATAMRTAVAARRDLDVLDVLDKTAVYLAGPMTGYPEFNFPAFKTAARDIDEMGVSAVYCTAFGIPPAPEEARPWSDYLRDALRLMLSCNAVVVLPGWRESKGARLEVHVALELGMPVVEYPDLRPVESLGDPRTRDEVEIMTFGGKKVHGPAGDPPRWTPVPEDEPHWSDATIDPSKDGEPAHKGRPMPDRPQA